MNQNSVKCNMIPSSMSEFKFARANLKSNKRFKTPESCWDEMETSHARPGHALASTIFGRSAHALSDGLLGKYDGMEQRECFQHCMLQQWNNGSSIKHLLCCPESVGSLEATLDKLGIPNNLASCTLVFSCIPMQSNGPNNCNTIPQLKKPRTESRSPGSIPCFSWMGRCRCWFYASFMHEVYLGNSCIVSECCESELIIAHPPIPFSGELLELKMESKASNLISVHLGNEIYTTNVYIVYIFILYI